MWQKIVGIASSVMLDTGGMLAVTAMAIIALGVAIYYAFTDRPGLALLIAIPVIVGLLLMAIKVRARDTNTRRLM